MFIERSYIDEGELARRSANDPEFAVRRIRRAAAKDRSRRGDAGGAATPYQRVIDLLERTQGDDEAA